VELRPYADEHLALSEALELDPEMMRELGGPADPEGLLKVHRRRVEDETWYFVIVPEGSAAPAGAIGIWDSTFNGEPIHEVGWMVLQEFHGRGIASEALGLILERARGEPRFKRIHAFPGVTNGPSNTLCRKFDFVHTEETEVKFRDRPLRVNHWELDVSAA